MKRLLIALALGGAVFAAVFAAAATLGLTTDQLGAGDRVVSSCDTQIVVDYDTEYMPDLPNAASGAPALGRYRISTVHLEGLDTTACAGQNINLVLTDIDGDPVPSSPAQGTDFTCCSAGNGPDLDVSSLNIDPRQVYGVHVVITGTSNTSADNDPQSGN